MFMQPVATVETSSDSHYYLSSLLWNFESEMAPMYYLWIHFSEMKLLILMKFRLLIAVFIPSVPIRMRCKLLPSKHLHESEFRRDSYYFSNFERLAKPIIMRRQFSINYETLLLNDSSNCKFRLHFWICRFRKDLIHWHHVSYMNKFYYTS